MEYKGNEITTDPAHTLHILCIMMRAAIAFFILAIVSLVLGLGGIAGLSLEIGKILLTVFLVLAVLSFLIHAITGKKVNLP